MKYLINLEELTHYIYIYIYIYIYSFIGTQTMIHSPFLYSFTGTHLSLLVYKVNQKIHAQSQITFI